MDPAMAHRLHVIKMRFGEFYEVYFDHGDYCAKPRPHSGIAMPRRVFREGTAADLTAELVADFSGYNRQTAH